MNPRRTSRLAARNAGLLCLGIGVSLAVMALQARSRARGPARDYSGRSGLPRPVDEMRGVARTDFAMPPDMATPPPLQPLVKP